MFNWLREWYELRAYLAEKQKVCNSCEVLKTELNNAHRENEILLNRLLNKPEPEPVPVVAPPMNTIPIARRHLSYNIKSQMMQAEETARRRALSVAAKPDDDVAELEKELDVVAQERENQSGKTANSSGSN